MMPNSLKRIAVPFGYKVMFSYLIFVLVAVLGIGYFAYTASVDSIRRQTEARMQDTLGQMRDNVNYKTESVKRISDLIFFDQTMQKTLRVFRLGFRGYETTKEYLHPTFENVIKLASSKTRLKLYLNNPQIWEYYGDLSEDKDPLAGSNTFDVLHLSRLEGVPWYRELPWQTEKSVAKDVFKGTEAVWRQVGNDANFGNISLLRRLFDIDEEQLTGVAQTTVRLDDLLEAAQHEKIGDESRLYVYNSEGQALRASGGPSMTFNALKQTVEGRFLLIEQPVPGVEWRLVALVPNELLEQEAESVRTITIAVCLAALVLLVFIGWLFSRHYSKKVRGIVVSLNAMREGEFRRRIHYSGRDEFAQIAMAFNRMSEHIDELIREVYLADLQQKEAELESLQAQINPHFLYNTLSSISRLAKFGETDNVHDMVTGIAKFYRLTLNEGRSLIPVEKELEQVGAYLDIQRIKYRNKLEVWNDIHPEVRGHVTVKIILQPFVENILEHALFGSGGIRIKLVAYKEGDTIIFQVIDDGIGMDGRTIRRIFEPDAVNGGYGIRNVHKRIQLQYGVKYGVSIASRRGIGTAVTITIPASREAR
ncbi:cache domain-containing sensor histidine kinase [Paenibacillus lignilyticus]|uniref:histidine kinase n=1 Tax=Paenibacillus lignilyticus TaxID=1172615 RepID=A0ABS5CGR2_9BACL|nr:histidine kinase [Paenibacillus lignilyticus]MBP3965074.1 sensor histidine kinase [Paenibacillus lignilyticus]